MTGANYTTERHRFERYGLTSEAYERLLEKQGRVCAVCKKPPKRFYVDHDHVSEIVRGLLCNRCNIAVGYLELATPEMWRYLADGYDARLRAPRRR